MQYLPKGFMKKISRISISAQVFFALLTITLIMSAVFSPYGFYTNIHSIRKSVDERLKVAVNGVREIIPDDYHDRLAEGRVSQAEYDLLRGKLRDFRERIGVTYLYSMAQGPDGKIYFTLDQLYDSPMCEYLSPSPDTLEAFRTKKPVFAQCTDDEFGLVSRTVLLPFTSPGGRFFVVGADLNVSEVRPMIVESLRDFLFLMCIGVILVMAVTLVLTRRISAPIRGLSVFTKRLADSNFSPEISMEADVPRASIRASEVAALADSITLMRSKLEEYIENLKSEMGARQRAESELKIAGQIQESFLPGAGIRECGISAGAAMKPARQAGGDLYDFFPLMDGRLCLAIGDVSGKGMPAALFMARAMTLIRSAANISSDISKIARFMNDALAENNESCTFITFFICAFNPSDGILEYVNCGHNPPFLRRAGRAPEAMSPRVNSILGVFEGAEFAAESVAFAPGDELVCYTDGVTEAQDSSGGFYGDGRLESLLASMPPDSEPGAVVGAVMADVAAFSAGAEQSDDITVLAFRRDA